MKKSLIIGLLLVSLIVIFLKNNIVDVYYSISNQAEVVFAQETLLLIGNNDFNNAKKHIFPGSKLLSDHILASVAKSIQKIHLDSGKVVRVQTLTDGESYSITEVVFFYENNYSAKIRVKLILEKQSDSLKVKDIFFNDAYFVGSSDFKK